MRRKRPELMRSYSFKEEELPTFKCVCLVKKEKKKLEKK